MSLYTSLLRSFLLLLSTCSLNPFIRLTTSIPLAKDSFVRRASYKLITQKHVSVGLIDGIISLIKYLITIF